MNRILTKILLSSLMLAFLILFFVYFSAKIRTTNDLESTALLTSLPSQIIYNNRNYIMAKCRVKPSPGIKRIGKTDEGLDVYTSQSVQNDNAQRAILLKLNNQWFQCYTLFNQ